MARRYSPWFALLMLVAAALACSTVPAAPAQAPQAVATQVAAVEVVKEAAMEAAPAEAPAAMLAAPQEPIPVSPTPAGMEFKAYGVNPFIDTEDDHLSTFGLDVDTGAYTVARSYINGGNLPPQEAVRVEEYVNYFDQDYTYPEEGRAFAINIDAAPFPFAETERYRMMRVGIQGYDVPPEERQDAVLTFVVDVSGSMSDPNKLELVKPSLRKLVESLRPTDKVGIVKYGSEAGIVLLPTPVENKQRILDAIDSLQTEGATNAEAGLKLGYELASVALDPEAINRVILLSDGVANVGETGPDAILRQIEEWAKQGILLTTVGFGMGEYNDVLMEQLADHGSGFYAYVDSEQEAEKLFVHDLTGTLQTIAMDAKVQVDFNPEVVARYRLLGFENRAIEDTEFRAETPKEAGEIGAGHNVTALYEIKLHPEVNEGRIATVFLRWTDPETKETIEIDQDFDSASFAESFAKAPPRFQWDVIVGEFAEILRGSPWAEGSTLAGVLEEAQRVARQLPEDAEVAEFVALLQRAVALPQAE